MVSKNNRIKRMEEAAERQSHFGIRKLTVGAASVLLGITLLFGANAKVARADETTGIVQSSAVQSSADTGTAQSSAVQSSADTGTAQSRADTGTVQSRAAEGETQSSRSSGSTDQSVVRRAEEPALFTVRDSGTGTSEQQDKNPDWYMTDPSKATDENAARKNLEQAIAYAKAHPIKGLDIKGEQDAEGRITIAPDPNKKNEVEDAKDAITIAYDNEKDSTQYMQSIANKIWDETKTYEAYEAEREKFMDGLAAEGLYNPKTDVDPTTLSQHLTLDSEPDAIVNLEIKNNSGDWITATKNGLENGLEIDKLETKENDLLTIYNGADKPDLDAMGSKRGWTVTFKKNDPVKDPFIRLTFTNLKNSHYDDGTNAAVVPIDKIVETFSDVHATNGDPAKFVFANDPTRGWWYNRCSGVTATIQLYGEYDKTDKNGKVEKEEKLITFNQPVYMSVSSLNSGGENSSYKESAELKSDGEAYRIPESSVIADNNRLYSPYYNNWYLDGKNDESFYDYWGRVFEPAAWKGATDEKQKVRDQVRDLGKHIVETYNEWDNPDHYNRIFGSGLYKVNGDQISVRSYVGGSQENQSISKYNHVWFAYSTIIPKTTFDAKHPGTTINYHFAKAINVNTSQTVKFVDKDGNQLRNPNTQDGFIFQIKDGKPNVESHTYHDVYVPAIEGYVADKTSLIKDKDGKYVPGPNIIVDKDGGTYVQGQKVTLDNPNVTIEVVYHKNPDKETVTGKVTYIDDDEKSKVLDTDSFSGKVGDKIDYTTAGEIQDYVNKGYELVSNNFKDGDEVFTNGENTFEVHFKHGTTTVTPDKPGNPGTAVDPKNPEGPKYPAGTDENAVKRIGTQTVHYEGAGDKTPADQKQSFTFTRDITFDNVTGRIINTTPWNETSHTFGYEKVPVVDGYHTTVKTAGGQTITPDDLNKTVTVTYVKDKVVPPVANTVTGKVTYIDDDEKSKVLDTDSFSGKVGDKIDYTTAGEIQDYVNKGYELVSNNFKDGDEVFTNGENTFEVHFKHGTITVTLTKDSTQTIIYHYSDGSKPDEKKTETHEDTFTRTKVVDKVTGEVITTTPWTGSHTFDSKDVPVVNGYHSDKKTVGGKTATVNNPDVTDTVTYTPNGKIIPVDPSGKPIPNVPTPTYPTDPNDPTKVVPNEPVPDVPGRTPEVSTVTPEDPSKDTPVVYNPVPNVPGPSVGPSDNTPTPVTPTPGKTTEEKKPEETKPDETKLDENKDDKDVDEPDDDEDVVSTPRHHKKHNGSGSSTTRPRPTGYTPAPRGSSYLDANGKVHYKLPQTGESDSEEMVAVLGGAAATIGLIGLAGAKKRRHE